MNTKSKRILTISVETGKTMLINGAETYRVEDTVKRMTENRLHLPVNVFVIPTGIIVSVDFENETVTKLYRVTPKGIDLEIIDRANTFAREFSASDMSLDDAEALLANFKTPPIFSNRARYFFGGMAGGFFVFLFGGTRLEFLISYFASALTLFTWDHLSKLELNFFIKNIFGGLSLSLLSFLGIFLATLIGYHPDYNMVIIGPLMTLVPGVSLTNGIRDLISGELLAGSAKIMEALFIAIALAFGVGMVLQLILGHI